MYFKRFPVIYYPAIINGVKQYSVLKDITVNVRFVKDFISNITLYDLYDIREGETPEIISEKFYGTPYYHWVIMLLNDRYDYIEDFPVSQNDLYRITVEKYGEDNVYSPHHYENAQGYVVADNEPLAIEVTNIEYEERMNEKKRTIKIVDASIIERVVDDFVKIIK